MPIVKALSFVVCVGLLTSCSHTYSPSVSQPDFSSMENFKKGEACSVTVLGIFGPFGDSSLMKAVWNAQLKTVHAVEKEGRSFILFGKDCTLAYGLQK